MKRFYLLMQSGDFVKLLSQNTRLSLIKTGKSFEGFKGHQVIQKEK